MPYIAANYNELAKERRRLQTRDADLSLRETMIAETEQERDTLEKQLEDASASIETLEKQITQLEEDLERVAKFCLPGPSMI